MIIDADFDARITAGYRGPIKKRPAPRPNGTVADQFRVEAAVVGKIDFLRHQSVKERVDFGGGMIDLNGEGRRLGQNGTGTRERHE